MNLASQVNEDVRGLQRGDTLCFKSNKRPALFLSFHGLGQYWILARRCPQSFIKSCCVKEGFGCLCVSGLGVPVTTGPLRLLRRSCHAWTRCVSVASDLSGLLQNHVFRNVVRNAYVVVLWVGRSLWNEFGLC